MLELSFLSAADASRIARGLEAIRRGLGEKVVSVLLVGPAVPPPRQRGPHRLELLAVVSDLPLPALNNLAHQVADLLDGGVELRLLTERELLRAADVFTLELCEVRDRHLRLWGADVLGDLHFTAGELRRSVEQTWRCQARQLRQGLLAAARSGPGRRDPTELVDDALDQMVVAAHHTLVLLGEAPPESEVALLRALAANSGVDAGPLLGWVARHRAGEPPTDWVPALSELLLVAEAAVSTIDRFGAAD